MDLTDRNTKRFPDAPCMVEYFPYIWHIFTVNGGKYSSPIEQMGLIDWHNRDSGCLGSRNKNCLTLTRIQKRAVGILENTQGKSAIAVEKDTVPLANGTEPTSTYPTAETAQCFFRDFSWERKNNDKNTCHFIEMKRAKRYVYLSKKQQNIQKSMICLWIWLPINHPIILSNSSDIGPPQNHESTAPHNKHFHFVQNQESSDPYTSLHTPYLKVTAESLENSNVHNVHCFRSDRSRITKVMSRIFTKEDPYNVRDLRFLKHSKTHSRLDGGFIFF